LDAWRAPPPDQQRCFFGETVTGSDVLDIAAVMAIAHDAGACWWISTLTTPRLIKPSTTARIWQPPATKF
jgi:O-acetylhomoserine/O-acetylserine sulfhydrylase-like pyridoxal-dependent enzyme